MAFACLFGILIDKSKFNNFVKSEIIPRLLIVYISILNTFPTPYKKSYDLTHIQEMILLISQQSMPTTESV